MNKRWTSTVVMIAALAVPAMLAAQAKPPAKPAAPAATPRTVSITVGDPVGEKMDYSLKTFTVKPGERIRLRLISTAQTPKIVMAHNWVLLKLKTNVKAFVDASANARETDFIPAGMKSSILAMVGMVGPGERLETTFTAPTVPGTYDYVCTFAGHYAAGMVGTMVVK
ncbi:MAG: plastocyanin/azurin family copper-binding protein [Vicinamibacterales bacterium]